MTTAADLLQALRARMPGKLIVDRRTGLPYGWGIWMGNRKHVAAPFNDDQVMDVLLAREQPARRGVASVSLVSPFQAFRSLWWQHWDPRPKDQRRQHWLAVLGSLLIHLGFIALLVWVVTVRWAPEETTPGDESRVRMTLIGDGAEEQGGGEGQPAAEASMQASAAAAPSPAHAGASAAKSKAAPLSTPTPAQPAADPVEPPDTAQAPEHAPEPVQAASEPVAADIPQVTFQVPPVTIESPLQVTETPVATTDFVVPPPPTITLTPRAIERAAPQVEVRQRDIQTLTERPQVRELQRPATDVALRTATAPTVRERDVVIPERPQISAPAARLREISPTVRMPDVAVRPAELPNVPDPTPAPVAATPVVPAAPAPATPDPQPAPSAQAAAQPAQSQASPAPSERSGSAAAAASSPVKPAASSHAGPTPADRSGGWDVAANADDWSKSDRNRQGDTTGANAQRNGMFNADGSVKVATGTGDAGKATGDRGPPGSEADTWTRDQIAQGGTWLKRPPYGYTPTSLDKYWMPNQTLLQEWVRRGLKKIEIPIPGTTTKISCVVSLLQLGGGCGLSDPNLNDQPATARPPPDVPFKRELQEDKGALPHNGGGA
ncbi:transmembrane repetitive protein [Xanthomonas citri pv. fuscans CFBP 6996]|uniref:transmembrane repetitive protein n=1 Tax=Xanthomonas citri TaxID=346 RepID=UPI000C1A0B32|nr:transmembrane repetitive protein [Xanthomonas citri]ATS51890.1 transmembrane repetitive protein [Xanthomonas citri pv. phaseoli var. fuscans]ATS57511.1 transmembrane repetitive protein [Xanthomonas citri pv. phaseoli var. fuscans]ATS58482.1 transmembrane repetitive protein [Xanthomonas citri pv. phaseoli var. fuscans]PTY32431.1 transmembrane repetitive protein [Xanthomonas citri pv. fuscans CFBP 6996]QWN16489.1 transmembrane repetitive protein [Xanthomonas citri]